MPKEPKEEVTNNDGLILATLYMQQSAEYQAICKQAYNIGKLKLDEQLKIYSGEKKLAVVVDIDETVLDNSPFSARSVLENTDYPKYWDEWCNKAEAKAIPGSVEFLNYAADNGVETFYISNRKVHLTEATLKNLQEKDFPFADSAHLLLRTNTSNKEPRRNKVRETHDILLLFGDNLGDFNPAFDDQPTQKRHALVQQMKNKFGEEYIVLPNPTYGAWMSAMQEGLPKNINVDSLYRAKLINF
jgi:5'-nucleotidase (lipoprotein e(P4) family)